MELKSYQKEVIADLARYLELVVELQSPAKAYQALWNAKNVLVGFGGMPNYVNVLSGVPHVCAKVPTGWMWILAGGYRCTPRSKPSWGRTLPLLR